MTKTKTNPVAKAMYDRRDAGAKRRVGRWNPGHVPYGVRVSRVLTPSAPLPTGLELNTVVRYGKNERAVGGPAAARRTHPAAAAESDSGGR